MVRRVTVDASVIFTLAEGCPRVRAHLEAFRRHDVEVIVPAPVIAQAIVGKALHDARANMVLTGCRIAELTERIARRAAVLCQRSGHEEAIVDALVVATSELVGGGALLTRRTDVCSALAVLTSVRVQPP
jgi:hypothetical protein